MSKVLTVSIAGYNVERYIKLALSSFAKEEYRELLEVFIVDDGGHDATLSIAQEYKEMFPDIFFPIHKENGGWGSTVNYGIAHASGLYFKQLDGDDYFNPANLSKFLEYLKDCDSDLVFTPFLSFEDGTNKNLSLTTIPEGIEPEHIYNYEEIADRVPLAMHSCTFKTSFLKENKVQITEKCFYTDIEFVLKAVANVKTVIFLDIDIYQYRIARSGQSMSYSGLRKHYKDHLLVTKTLISFVKGLNVTPKKLKALKDKVCYLVNNQYSVFFILKPTKEHKTELMMFDNYIKNNALEYYDNVQSYINIARKFGFQGYSLWVLLRYINHVIKLVTRGY